MSTTFRCNRLKWCQQPNRRSIPMQSIGIVPYMLYILFTWEHNWAWRVGNTANSPHQKTLNRDLLSLSFLLELLSLSSSAARCPHSHLPFNIDYTKRCRSSRWRSYRLTTCPIIFQNLKCVCCVFVCGTMDNEREMRKFTILITRTDRIKCKYKIWPTLFHFINWQKLPKRKTFSIVQTDSSSYRIVIFFYFICIHNFRVFTLIHVYSLLLLVMVLYISIDQWLSLLTTWP